MFALCRHTAKAANAEVKATNGHRVGPDTVKTVATGRMIAAAIEAIDTYRLRKNTNNQVITVTPKAGGMSAAMAPAEVATPLPPLNPNQQV
jgi:hypothetical protein